MHRLQNLLRKKKTLEVILIIVCVYVARLLINYIYYPTCPTCPCNEHTKFMNKLRNKHLTAIQENDKLRTPSIILGLWGGLGNRMFLYASAFCLAKEKKIALITLSQFVDEKSSSNWGSILEAFPKLSTSILDTDPIIFTDKRVNWTEPSLKYIEYNAWAEYDATISKTITKGFHYFIFNNYLQSWRYFDMCKNDIYKEFTFHKMDQIYADSILQSAAKYKRDVIFVGIHIRRGDLLDEKNVKAGFVVPRINYLKKAINFFERKYPDKIHYVVASDNMPYSKSLMYNLTTSNKLTFSEDANPSGDLAVLANCNKTIMTTGSFGWWAAYLAKGETIYFTGYIKPGSPVSKGYKREDLYPPHWIGMNDD